MSTGYRFRPDYVPPDPPKPGYVMWRDVERATGVTHRQFDFWVNKYGDQLGVHVLNIRSGTGVKRWVREGDLDLLWVLKELSRFGVAIGSAVKLSLEDRSELCEWLSERLDGQTRVAAGDAA
jgi:hypothetical protein